MQQELQDLQPELIKTSKETEILMTKIEKDTVEAEAKKEVFTVDVLNHDLYLLNPGVHCSCSFTHTVLCTCTCINLH